jgi:spore germination cell wall hydrolase CwlJ-like protein
VLWYHADYVAPTWKNHLSKVEKIGAHIFYRA